MPISCATSQRPQNWYRQLIQRHFVQIDRRSDDEHDKLSNVLAIAFRPGNHTASFLGQTQRTLGTATLVALSYGRDDETGRRNMPIVGLRGTAARDGAVTYGGAGNTLFHHDVARRPSVRSHRKALNPQRNPSLTELARAWTEREVGSWQDFVGFPAFRICLQIMLGFAASEPPSFEETPVLRELAAAELDVPVDQLGSNGPMLFEIAICGIFGIVRSFIPEIRPTAPAVCSVIAELCTQAHRALRIYEDFTHLLGAPSWNPGRRVGPMELPNPAKQILERFGVDLSNDFSQFISDQQLAEMEQAIRKTIGSQIPLTTDEIYDALTNPELPLRSWSAVLPRLRAFLEPAIAECTTDDDLLHAARSPDQPLISSGRA